MHKQQGNRERILKNKDFFNYKEGRQGDNQQNKRDKQKNIIRLQI